MHDLIGEGPSNLHRAVGALHIADDNLIADRLGAGEAVGEMALLVAGVHNGGDALRVGLSGDMHSRPQQRVYRLTG